MKTKLEKFVIRNRRRNASLYTAGLVEGYDFIVCPESGARMLIIRSDYVTKVLEMSIEEYDQKYPDVQKRCQRHRDNIKKGLHKIDQTSGLTKYELGQVKARAILKEVDENGVSGYKKKGQKTRATHIANVDEMGRNGYSQLASKAIIKGNKTKAAKGLILDPSLRSEFYRYKSVIAYLTEKHRKQISKGYVVGLAGENNAWHIDHIFSIMDGYKHGVSPLLIGNLHNLRMIPWEENLSKHAKSEISLEKLLELTNYTKTQSDNEFAIVMQIIRENMADGDIVSGSAVLEKLYETTICK